MNPLYGKLLVLPLLAALGWDTLDPDRVIREFGLPESLRVDYALAPVGHKPALFIEVKSPGKSFGGDRQLFEYAFHVGIPMAVLTDGREWSFYLPGEQGSYDDRRCYKLDLTERSEEECAFRLNRYMEFDRVRNGNAIKSARSDYEEVHRQKEVAESIPKAWRELIGEPDELLIVLIAERAESLCGFKPNVEDVEQFLIELPYDSVSEKPAPMSYKGRTAQITPVAEHIQALTRRKQGGQRSVELEIFGQKAVARNAQEAMLLILRKLAERNPDFLTCLAQRARSRKRNHLARSRGEVYPDRPDLAASAIEIVPESGWFIGLNIANREKHRIIKAACECANITFGRDVKITLPNINT